MRENGIWVGVLSLAMLLAALLVCLKVANVTSLRAEPAYHLHATFDNIGDLKARSPIRIDDVIVGWVTGVTLDPRICLPHVELDIDEHYDHIPDTSSLAIHTSGLLGEQHLTLSVSFEDLGLGATILRDDDTIQDAKSAMVLEDLVGQFLYNSKGGSNRDSNNDKVGAESYTDATSAAGMTH